MLLCGFEMQATCGARDGAANFGFEDVHAIDARRHLALAALHAAARHALQRYTRPMQGPKRILRLVGECGRVPE